ncbi:expressed unknown protein [Seminavis robusta]|uniref:Uncharacterized protein n=1 Tax=Seminavis robusta TaxID=568900 RepID=A0A9N8DVW4_9STRA|nr:expressed unknown protein [Seminavis robusta]|eukprot:Sro333_g119600.1 n/a (486) ;mRNA; f:50334-51791
MSSSSELDCAKADQDSHLDDIDTGLCHEGGRMKTRNMRSGSGVASAPKSQGSSSKRKKAKDEQDDDDRSVESIIEKHGTYGDEETDVPWNGCVCGKIHGRPTPVYWIECEGPCKAWFNVTPKCVEGVTAEEAKSVSWTCRKCTKLLAKVPVLLCDLPTDVLYRILEFTAAPTFRAGVLMRQLAPLCKAANVFLTGSLSKGIWQAVLQREYIVDQASGKHNKKKSATTYKVTSNPRRASKRRRKRTDMWGITSKVRDSDHPRHSVQEEHLELIARTEEMYYQAEELADPFNGDARKGQMRQCIAQNKRPNVLTLTKLRQLLQRFAPVDISRVSPCTGRTLLQVVCCGDMDEGPTVSCAEYLLQHYDADPNQFSTREEPHGNRPALFFAISRAMPKLVQTLIDAGASLTTTISGKFRRTFDATQSIEGVFTPSEFALAIKQVEVIDAQRPVASPYWVSRLNVVIRTLREASQQAQSESEFPSLKQLK